MNTRANNLVQHWVLVADETGSTHLESQWVDASLVSTHATSAA
jgi:hypothetical protein